MKYSAFHISIIIGVIINFIQLIRGYEIPAIFGILVLILIVLMGILEYQRFK